MSDLERRLQRIEEQVAANRRLGGKETRNEIVLAAMTEWELGRLGNLLRLFQDARDGEQFKTSPEYREVCELYSRADARLTLAERRGDPGAIERIRIECQQAAIPHTNVPADYKPELNVNDQCLAWYAETEAKRSALFDLKVREWERNNGGGA